MFSYYKNSQKTPSQSSLGETLRISTVAHTFSPTPSVLSNISQIQLPTSVLNLVKEKQLDFSFCALAMMRKIVEAVFVNPHLSKDMLQQNDF
ncbi:7845_t:CDS:2 [Funneliformis caledonium]|uniref:7845_t:CDS:1 n=1 Tax=Funneliformis caledonium TaxID=1117310 RepID=A0A9N9APE7_9GLOM|nr:7845_t:CDS:2 [Funneliformis caledonium]